MREYPILLAVLVLCGVLVVTFVIDWWLMRRKDRREAAHRAAEQAAWREHQRHARRAAQAHRATGRHKGG